VAGRCRSPQPLAATDVGMVVSLPIWGWNLKRFAYIDAVRGYAILMVIGVHSSQMFTALPWATMQVATQGARGVQLFFVASALTLCLSWQRRDDGPAAFYTRRLFRIAPMFWLALAYFVTKNGLGPSYFAPTGITTVDVGATALFVHGFLPNAITSVVPGSWSVADEMIFYALFPLIAVYLLPRSWIATAILMGASIWLNEYLTPWMINNSALFISDPTHRYMINIFVTLWFPQQLPVFLTGVMVAQIMRSGSAMPTPMAAGLLAFSIAALVFCAFLPFAGGAIWMQTIYGLFFGLFVISLANCQPAALVNPAVIWIGKVSFSAYLIHFALLEAASGLFAPVDPAAGSLRYLASAAELAAAAIALSSVTYLAVERPFIWVGNWLIRRHRAPLVLVSPAPVAHYADAHPL
jgi:peptidoglycan/LPS O-acetylase OafA/YrhL